MDERNEGENTQNVNNDICSVFRKIFFILLIFLSLKGKFVSFKTVYTLHHSLLRYQHEERD